MTSLAALTVPRYKPEASTENEKLLSAK